MKRKLVFYLFMFGLLPSMFLHGWEIKRETTVTADGVTLVAKRYANPGGIPVILLHGFASNYNTWDVPGRSLGEYLADRGFDAWLFNLRGHGEWQYQSGPDQGPGDWDFDTFAVYDIPAMVEKVYRSTGKRPFWVGHSMGGMLIYAYLEGTLPKKTKYGVTVTSSPATAEERNHLLRGFVTVGSSAGLTYPVQLKGKGLRALVEHPYGDYNLLLEMVASIPWQKFNAVMLFPIAYNETITKTLMIPPQTLLNESTFTFMLTMLSPLFYSFLDVTHPADMGYFHKYISKHLNMTPMEFLMGNIWNLKNTRRQDVYFMAQHGLDNISPRLLQQFHMWLSNRSFNELCDGEECNNFDYLRNLSRITAPALLIAGELDKLGNKDNIKVRVFKNIKSRDKTYKVFSGFGHVDLCMGKDVEEVFNYIYEWLRAHE